MKLIKTIKKIIEEAEQHYNSACEGSVSFDELDRLEKNYKDSLKLLKLYKIKEEKSTKKRQ
jgi:hypothetical protein